MVKGERSCLRCLCPIMGVFVPGPWHLQPHLCTGVIVTCHSSSLGSLGLASVALWANLMHGKVVLGFGGLPSPELGAAPAWFPSPELVQPPSFPRTHTRVLCPLSCAAHARCPPCPLWPGVNVSRSALAGDCEGPVT